MPRSPRGADEHGSALDMRDLQLATKVISGKWKIPILAQLAMGPARFGALRRAIETVSEKVPIQQLRELEADGMVTREVLATVPPHVTYALSAHGETLCEVVEALARWGATHRRHVEPARSSGRRR